MMTSKLEWNTVAIEPEDEEVLCYGGGCYLVGYLVNKKGLYCCESEECTLNHVTHWLKLTVPPAP